MDLVESLVQSTLLGEAVENGPGAVFVADETMRYVAVNRAACDLLGYTREELLKMRVGDVAADTTEWSTMERDGKVSGTAELVRKDGTHIKFSYVAGETVVAGMPVYVSVGVAVET